MVIAPARLRPLLVVLPLGAALLMATSACGGSDAAAPAQSAAVASTEAAAPVSTDPAAPAAAESAPAAAAPADPAVKEITVTIAGRKVTPPPDRIEVTKGQTVRITVTSDTADEAHLHGYDKEAA
ncbi:hypothetical protein GCM10027612_26670 [Microbispora bryophytorum subsp. camponoti]